MRTVIRSPRSRAPIAFAAFATLAVVPPSSAQSQTAPCEAVEVEYAIAANLALSDTVMGQGDGIYPIGPGTAVIRYAQRDGVLTGPATLVSYATIERVTIHATLAFWKTRVTLLTRTTSGSDAHGKAASGFLSGTKLEWTSDVQGARTDGTLTCEGFLCGKGGAPRPGTSPIHVSPHGVRFQPWVFAPDMTTFAMSNTWVGRAESPRHTSHVAISGREIRRRQVNACSQEDAQLPA